jgi:protein-S-isoprenylcysteine O-methyltransferase Ste14
MHPTLLFWLPLASVAGLYIARLIELKTKRDTIPGPVKENLTLRLFVLGGTLILLGSILEYLFAGRGLHWVLFTIGWACGLLSFWIRRQAIKALGRFWSLHVEIRENHEFVRTGPFRFVRHPAYFSMILELLAFALICNAWIMLVAIPLIYFPILALRLRLEEAALIEKFGDAYREYRRTTPALFPRPW